MIKYKLKKVGTYTMFVNDKYLENFNIEVDKQALVIAKESMIINAEPSEILAVLSNIKNWPSWRSDIEYTEILNEKSQQEIKFKWKSKGLKYTSMVHTYSDNLFGWTGRTFGAFAIHNWQLKSVKTGTEVEVSESLTGVSIRLMKKKMMKELPEMMRKDLQDLKNKCEKIDLEKG